MMCVRLIDIFEAGHQEGRGFFREEGGMSPQLLMSGGDGRGDPAGGALLLKVAVCVVSIDNGQYQQMLGLAEGWPPLRSRIPRSGTKPARPSRQVPYTETPCRTCGAGRILGPDATTPEKATPVR